MKNSVRRSRAILRASAWTLRQNPTLLWFPILSALALGAMGVACGSIAVVAREIAAHPVADLGSIWSLLANADPNPEVTLGRGATVGGVVAYLGSHLVMIYTGVAMSHASLEALAGRQWTVGEAFARARSRRGAIGTYALIRATVSRLLADRRERGKRGKRRRPGPLRKLARFSWWAATYLVLPVLAREDRGGFGAIERSASLFKETWKETFVARLALGWVWGPVFILLGLPLLVCLALGVKEEAVFIAAAAVPIVGLGFFSLVLHTLHVIYRAALYTFATEGVVPEPFAVEDLDDVWSVPPAQEGGPASEPATDAGTGDANPGADPESDAE